MRNMEGEVKLNIPAAKAWEMYRDNEIISKINPKMLTSAEYIEGDGHPGSLRLFKLGSAVRYYVKESVEKIEKVDNGRSVSYRVIGGELQKMYDPYIVTFSFLRAQEKGKDEEMCIAKWQVEYETLIPTTPPPEKARDAALAFLMWFNRFASA